MPFHINSFWNFPDDFKSNVVRGLIIGMSTAGERLSSIGTQVEHVEADVMG